MGGRRFALALVALTTTDLTVGHAQTAGFNLTINFSSMDPLTASQQAVFTTAEQYWESRITGYRPSGLSLTGITITASAPVIDGAGGVLGSAGPTSSTTVGPGELGVTRFRYTTAGQMRFDSADLVNLESSGRLLPVILHEMAHVIGIGTQWASNNVYTNGTGQYTGAAALAAYQSEFNQPGAAFIPVELGGGGGTANGHWNEVDSGAGLTGITSNLSGLDLRNELMTGWLNTPYFVSEMTVQSYFDIGYVVVPVPEPAGVGLTVVAGLAAVGRWRRRQTV